ncbi:hypothetical protein [Actinoplanes rectilineatus]|nr:hypothetical protein [Actinoplanes rectilineatus]
MIGLLAGLGTAVVALAVVVAARRRRGSGNTGVRTAPFAGVREHPDNRG